MLTRFRRPADARLFAVVAAIAGLLGAVAVAGSLEYVGRTFPGFVTWSNLVVAALGRTEWTGVVADVPYRNRVTAVDGTAVRTRAELERAVRATRPGTVHYYEFDGVRGPTARAVASMRFKFGGRVMLDTAVARGARFVLEVPVAPAA